MNFFSGELFLGALLLIIAAGITYFSWSLSEQKVKREEEFSKKKKVNKLYLAQVAVAVLSAIVFYWSGCNQGIFQTENANQHTKISDTLHLVDSLQKISNQLGEINRLLILEGNKTNTRNSSLIESNKTISIETKSLSEKINKVSNQTSLIVKNLDQKTDDEFAVTGTLSLKTAVDINKTGGLNFKVGGTNIFNYSPEELSKPVPISAVFKKISKLNSGFENISIRYSNNNIYLSGTIYDINKNIIVELVDNKWRVNKALIYKFNFDDHGIELFNHLGQVVFSLDINERNQVQIQGISYNHDLNVVGISTTSGLVILNLLENNFQTRLDDALDKHKFMPIFEYTGDVWRRVRVRSTYNK